MRPRLLQRAAPRALCTSASACWRPTRARNRFGEVAGPFLSFLQDYADYNDFRYVCKKQMGLDKVFYVLDPASGALTTLDSVDGALLERVSGGLSDSVLEEEEPSVLERTL